MLNRSVLILLSLISLISFSFCGMDDKMIQQMREEEKMTYDLYMGFYDVWNLDVFYCVGESEFVHKQRIKELLDYYNIEDPLKETSDEPGKFTNKKIQRRYDDYLKRGTASLTDALMISAMLEEQSIINLRTVIKDTPDDNYPQQILAQLEKSTRYHICAYVKSLWLKDIDYKPQILFTKDYEEIIFATDKGAASN